MKCKIEEVEFDSLIKLNIILSEKNFENAENLIVITNTNDFKVTITNTHFEKQTLKMELTGDYSRLIEPTENEKIFAKDETRDLYFKIINPTLLEILGNGSKGELMITSENGYVKKIPINVNINTNNVDEFKLNWIYLIIFIIIFAIIIIFILRYIRLGAEEVDDEGEEVQNNNEEYI